MGDGVRYVRLVLLAALGCTLAAHGGCGSSTSQNVTSPSSDARCNLTVSLDGRPIWRPPAAPARSASASTGNARGPRAGSRLDRARHDRHRPGERQPRLHRRRQCAVNVAPRRHCRQRSARRGVAGGGALRVQARRDDPDGGCGGDRYAIAVSAQNGCTWTASTEASWVELAPASGNGEGSVTVTVARNDGAARTGALVIAGLTHTRCSRPRRSRTPPTPDPAARRRDAATSFRPESQPVGAEGGAGAVTSSRAGRLPLDRREPRRLGDRHRRHARRRARRTCGS